MNMISEHQQKQQEQIAISAKSAKKKISSSTKKYDILHNSLTPSPKPMYHNDLSTNKKPALTITTDISNVGLNDTSNNDTDVSALLYYII